MKKRISLLVLFIAGNIAYSQTVTIGKQVWSAKNLDVSTFRNGDPIPQAKTRTEWFEFDMNEQPAWCYYADDLSNGTKYGKLYNWYAVIDARGLAPEGYHIPTDAEWEILCSFAIPKTLRSASGWPNTTSGGSKKCPNCASWNTEYRKKVPCHTCKDTRFVSAPTETYSSNGSNSSGFSCLPGGYRDNFQEFNDIGKSGYWWSSTNNYSNYAWGWYTYYPIYGHVHTSMEKSSGLSVRYIKD
jgi:uncharacterized protein (TIGR02145 family)